MNICISTHTHTYLYINLPKNAHLHVCLKAAIKQGRTKSEIGLYMYRSQRFDYTCTDSDLYIEILYMHVYVCIQQIWKSMYIYMLGLVRGNLHTYIHTHVFITHTDKYTCVWKRLQYMWMQTYMHTYRHKHTKTHTRTHGIQTHILSLENGTNVHTFTNTCIHIKRADSHKHNRQTDRHTHRQTHVHKHTHAYTN